MYKTRLELSGDVSPGCALLRLKASTTGSSPLEFSISKVGGTENNLGPRGWQASEHWFQAAVHEILDDGFCTVVVGPEIVQVLNLANYLLGVRRSGDTYVEKGILIGGFAKSNAPISSPDIRPVGNKNQDGSRSNLPVSSITEPIAVPVLEPVLPPASVPEPITLQTPMPKTPTVKLIVDDEPWPSPAVTPTKTAISNTPAVHSKSGPSKTTFILLIIFVVLCLLGVWYFFIYSHKETLQPVPTSSIPSVKQQPTFPVKEPKSELAPTPKSKSEPKIEPKIEPKSEPKSEPISIPPKLTPPEKVSSTVVPSPNLPRPSAQEANKLVNSGWSPDQLYQVGLSWKQGGFLAEAFLVLEASANRGNPNAALALGEMFDPSVLGRLANAFPTANASTAAKWYGIAKNRGINIKSQVDNLLKYLDSSPKINPHEAAEAKTMLRQIVM